MRFRHDSPLLKKLYYWSWSAVVLFVILSVAQCARKPYSEARAAGDFLINSSSEYQTYKTNLEQLLANKGFSAIARPNDEALLWGSSTEKMETYWYEKKNRNKAILVRADFSPFPQAGRGHWHLYVTWSYYGYVFYRERIKSTAGEVMDELKTFNEDCRKQFAQEGTHER